MELDMLVIYTMASDDSCILKAKLDKVLDHKQLADAFFLKQ
jgi:hypothetical protein